jgi:DNA-binding transcriptional MerR regulator
MTFHPISKLAQFSGIKAHTIRIWEKRYYLQTPYREGNHRNYSLEQLKHFLNISLLVQNGYKISRLALLDTDSVSGKAKSLTEAEARHGFLVNQLIVSMNHSDTDSFEDTLDNCVYEWGIQTSIEEIILPFMYKVGLLSYYSNRGEVHFVVTAIRNKLILGIEKVVQAQLARKKALLFLPKDEHFDLILLYLNYQLKKAGYKVLYLGTNVSEASLKEVILEKSPEVLYTYIVPSTKTKGKSTTSFLKTEFPALELHKIEAGIDLKQLLDLKSL